MAIGSHGEIYELQRGNKAAPILVLDADGRVLRSWGHGDFAAPHSLRRDRKGHVWTVDASSSTVIEYSDKGDKLKTIVVGEQPPNGGHYNGTTDIAFGPNGHLWITDGYSNSRVLEYTRAGKRLKQWGRLGTASGEFHLPHAIQIDTGRSIYIADRENGRIEHFDLAGNYLGELAGLERVFCIKFAAGVLWATVQTHSQPVTSGGWLVKLDPVTGAILGHMDIPELGGHWLDVSATGEPYITVGDHVLYYVKK